MLLNDFLRSKDTLTGDCRVSFNAPGPRPQRARCRARAAPGAMGGGRGRPKKEDAGARGPGAPPRPGKCNPCFYVQRDEPRRTGSPS